MRMVMYCMHISKRMVLHLLPVWPCTTHDHDHVVLYMHVFMYCMHNGKHMVLSLLPHMALYYMALHVVMYYTCMRSCNTDVYLCGHVDMY